MRYSHPGRRLSIALGVLVPVLCLQVSPVLTQEPRETMVLGNPGTKAMLPPELPWSGKSRSLLVSPGDRWATPFEKSDLNSTPRYKETMDWLRGLAKASPDLAMVTLGKSPEGRDIWMLVAARDQEFEPQSLRRNGKPTLLAQAGIHSGEIDGKDAGMMFLRDLTVKNLYPGLLDRANFLFIPIFSVDGHERFSRFGRINQRGPVESGWRTTSRNLNLNRDYTKLDTPEMQHLIRALNQWEPDLYLDLHVTDGVDYQYDITWGYNGPHCYSANATAWLDAYLTPALTHGLNTMGHVPGPLVFAVDPTDMTKGNRVLTFGPRYSNGYGDARHLPTVLVENHSLKPYLQRVLGTYVFLRSAFSVLGEHGKELERAIQADTKARRKQIPLGFKASSDLPNLVSFKGVRSRLRPSPISGGLWVEWTGEPVLLEIPSVVHDEPTIVVSRPKAYWIPPAWDEVVRRLEMHGIKVDRIDEPVEVAVTMYRMADAKIDPDPFEGHVRAGGTPVAETRVEQFPPGSVRVSTDQPLGDLLILLLEPGSPDSFYQWGFFLEILSRTEYVEGYVIEPMASQMLADNPELAREFKRKLGEESEFTGNVAVRRQWFYHQTPFFDERWRLYPVAREE